MHLGGEGAAQRLHIQLTSRPRVYARLWAQVLDPNRHFVSASDELCLTEARYVTGRTYGFDRVNHRHLGFWSSAATGANSPVPLCLR